MRIFILLTFLFLNGPVWSQQKIEEIEQFEIRSYSPQKQGLTDLVYEIRMDNLTEMLNKTQTLGKLTDVHFKIYWMNPDKYKIEVLGLPKGFQEIRNDLTTLIKGKLEFVLPETFSKKFEGYTLKAEASPEGKLIKAVDEKYNMQTSEIDIIFDRSAVLKSIETKAPMSVVKNSFTYSPKAWSNNKLVLDKVVSTTRQGTSVATTTNTIEYLSVGGLGFPSKIIVKNVQEGTIPANGKEKEKKVKNENGATLRFSKYETNTGKAQRFMEEGLRR